MNETSRSPPRVAKQAALTAAPDAVRPRTNGAATAWDTGRRPVRGPTLGCPLHYRVARGIGIQNAVAPELSRQSRAVEIRTFAHRKEITWACSGV